MPVKEQMLRIPHPKALPNLSLIGVPEGMQSRAPSPASYPERFNDDARFVWEKMFKDDEFVTEINGLKNDGNIEQAWYNAIVEFLRKCEEVGALPFFPVTEQEKNDAVINSLSHARIALVKYVNGIGLFQRVKVDRVHREYHAKEHGFAVISWANLRPISDPTFTQWLVQAPTPRFMRSTGLSYTKLILPNCLLSIRYPNSTRAVVKFEIQVATPLSIPGNRLASRKDVDIFVDRVIWLPIVRAHRFEDIGMRLF